MRTAAAARRSGSSTRAPRHCAANRSSDTAAICATSSMVSSSARQPQQRPAAHRQRPRRPGCRDRRQHPGRHVGQREREQQRPRSPWPQPPEVMPPPRVALDGPRQRPALRLQHRPGRRPAQPVGRADHAGPMPSPATSTAATASTRSPAWCPGCRARAARRPACRVRESARPPASCLDTASIRSPVGTVMPGLHGVIRIPIDRLESRGTLGTSDLIDPVVLATRELRKAP